MSGILYYNYIKESCQTALVLAPASILLFRVEGSVWGLPITVSGVDLTLGWHIPTRPSQGSELPNRPCLVKFKGTTT